jgi:hypothetical protein
MGLPQGRTRTRRTRAGKMISQPSASSLLHTTKRNYTMCSKPQNSKERKKSHQKNTCKNLTSYYAKEIFEMDVECTTQYYHPLLLVSDTQAKPTTTQPCAARFLRATGAMAATVQQQTSLLAVAELCCLAWLGLAWLGCCSSRDSNPPQVSPNKPEK